MIDAMLSLFSPTFCSRDRKRHSEGLIFWYRRHSIIVSCRATSKGWKSKSFCFLESLGTIGWGCASNEIVVLALGLSPLLWNGSVCACDGQDSLTYSTLDEYQQLFGSGQLANFLVGNHLFHAIQYVQVLFLEDVVIQNHGLKCI